MKNDKVAFLLWRVFIFSCFLLSSGKTRWLYFLHRFSYYQKMKKSFFVSFCTLLKGRNDSVLKSTDTFTYIFTQRELHNKLYNGISKVKHNTKRKHFLERWVGFLLFLSFWFLLCDWPKKLVTGEALLIPRRKQKRFHYFSIGFYCKM